MELFVALNVDGNDFYLRLSDEQRTMHPPAEHGMDASANKQFRAGRR